MNHFIRGLADTRLADAIDLMRPETSADAEMLATSAEALKEEPRPRQLTAAYYATEDYAAPAQNPEKDRRSREDDTDPECDDEIELMAAAA